MIIARHRMAAAFAVALAAALPACGGGDGGGTTGPVPVAAVVITSPTGPVTLATLGRTVAFTAQARDAAGNPIAGKTFTWSSSDPSVASVNASSGLVTAVANGATNIVATSDGVPSAPYTVTVLQAVADVVVSPANISFGAVGRTLPLAATPRDSNTNAVAGATVAWSSTNAAVATVDATTGVVTSVGNGTAQIQATAGGRVGQAVVTVNIVIASLTLAPTSRTFTRINDSVQVAATARDSASNVVANPTITWTSRNTAVVTVSTTGRIFAVADGTTYVVATATGGVRDSVGVTVAAVANSVVVTPASVAFGAIGSTRQLAAVVRDSADTTIPGRTVTWSLSGPGTTATVGAAGLVQSVAVGTGDSAVATAAGPVGPIPGKAPITVTQVVNTVTVTGSLLPDTLKTTGRSKQFAASAADSNGNAIPGTVFTWTSSAGSVAGVDPSGLVTAVSDGEATIQAAAGGKTGSRTMVVRRYAEAFSLVPAVPPAITTAGGTQVFTGTAQDSSGANLLISWLSRTTTVATVSPATGTATTATAVGDGTTRIVMSGGTRSDSASLTVSIPVSLANDVQPIFTANCAVSGCHTGPSPTGPGLNLSAGQARSNLVNVASVGFPGATRVIPNDPDNSYLIRKLENRNIVGVRMPDLAAALPQTTINIIRGWIAQGAPNN